MKMHPAHPTGYMLRTRTLLDYALYNEAGNTQAESPMYEAKKRGKGNVR
jgi:hypothetical protein